ncbi:LrgB family protein [Fredinandcohnia humi]
MIAVYLIASIVGTIVIFLGMAKLYKRYTYPLLVPIATTTFILIVVLLLFSIPYDTYMIGGRWIDELLGPAVVALAFPLYQNREALKKYFLPIFTGVLVGSTTGVVTGIYFSRILLVEKEIILSLAPKSVTSPVAMDIAQIVGGVPSLSAVYVMIAGITGAMFGPYLLKVAKVNHYIGVGLGFGAASHGIGTAKALELGSNEGAISSVAMVLSAIYTAAILPPMLHMLL